MDMGIISLIAATLGLVLMMYLAFKGMSLLLIGPIISIFVLALSGMDIMTNMSGVYSKSLGSFVTSNFLIFLTASIFGSFLGECGAAEDIAFALTEKIDKMKKGNKKFIALMMLSLVFAILTFGGVSAFVVVFTMVPFCKRVFKKYDIPWHLYMAIHSFGANLFTATMLPGSPAIQNLIPIKYLHTTPMAAPVMGIVVTIYSIILAVIYIKWVLGRAEKKNEGFMLTGSRINETILAEDSEKSESKKIHGPVWKAILSPILVLILMNAFNVAPELSLMIGIILCCVLYLKRFDNVLKSLGKGAMDGSKTLLVVASIVGFGGVVTAIPGYTLMINGLTSIPGSPLIQLVIAVNAVAAITGSASGGESIAFQAFGARFASMGYPPAVIHRVTAIACQGLDSLPHGGSIINQLETARLTHKQGYFHVFIISAIIPLSAGFVAVACYYLGLI